MQEKSSFNSLKKKERRERQEIIVDAAERVFARKPFDSVSIRDIAGEAGISHASIYRYFPDQQTLFVEAFLRGAENIVNFLSDLVDSANESSIELVTERFICYLIENDRYFRMMTHFMLDGSLSGELVERLNETERSLIDQLDRLFLKMNVEGEVRLLSHAFFAAMNGVLITFRNYPGRSRQEVVSHMIQLGRIIANKFST